MQSLGDLLISVTNFAVINVRESDAPPSYLHAYPGYLNYDHGLQDAQLRSFVVGSESFFIPQPTTE